MFEIWECFLKASQPLRLGIEPRSPTWQAGILTTILTEHCIAVIIWFDDRPVTPASLMDYILISGPLVTGQPESCADVTAWSDLLAAAFTLVWLTQKSFTGCSSFHSLCQSRQWNRAWACVPPACRTAAAAARPGPGSQGLRLVSQSAAGLRLNLSLLLVGSAAALVSAMD